MIKSATEALGQVIQKIGAAVYQEPNVPGSESGGSGTNPNPEPEAGPDVVEGEVKE
jgi:hypothetical protein